MTHSGGKPHTNIGDRGQRYELRSTGWPSKETSVVGWNDTLDGAQQMAATIRKAPGCTATLILDRHNESKPVLAWTKPIAFDPACLELAEHFLQDEPKLRHRADELAGEVQRAVEDWITVEREEPSEGEP